MKAMLMLMLMLMCVALGCVLGSVATAADARLRIDKRWQPFQTFADGTVVSQHTVYTQNRVPLNHFDRPVPQRQRMKIVVK